MRLGQVYESIESNVSTQKINKSPTSLLNIKLTRARQVIAIMIRVMILWLPSQNWNVYEQKCVQYIYIDTYLPHAHTDIYAYHGEAFEIHDECKYHYIIPSCKLQSDCWQLCFDFSRTLYVSANVANFVCTSILYYHNCNIII